MASIRFMLAMTVQNDFIIYFVDAVSTYLARTLDKELYIESLEGYKTNGKVYKLIKSIYGLEQSTQVWNHKLRDHLVANEYRQLHSDYGLYTNEKVIIAAYVDDMAIARPIKDLGIC